MTTAILQEVLSKALATVGKAVATGSTLPVLQNVLLQATPKGLLVAGNNLDMSIATYVPAHPEGEWDITVPYRLLSDFVGQLPRERVDIDFVEEDMSIALTCGSFEANIRGIDADEFPGTPTAAPEGWITVPLPADFSERVGRVAFAAATDESRPVFQGVALVLNRLNFTMVAADGFRLSLDQMTWDCPEAVGQQIDESGIKWTETSDTELPHLIYIVPAAALTEVGRIAKDSGSPLSMHVDPDGRQVVFTCGPTTVTSALIEGDFPNYHRVPPTNHTTSTVIDRSQLSRAVKMSHIFAKYGADILKVTITPSPNGGAGTVALFARSDEAGDNEAELSAAIEGEPVEIAFSAVYLGQALAAVNGWEQVRLQTGTPSAPGKLEVVGLDDWTHVIMPMHI